MSDLQPGEYIVEDDVGQSPISLQKLQRLIIDKDKKSGQSFNLDRILSTDFITDDAYGTLLLAGDNGIIDPNELLVEAVEETIKNSSDFFQIIGLALRMGANPNIYVTSVPRRSDKILVFHILWYAWSITPATPDEFLNEFELLEFNRQANALLDIVALLSVAGSDFKLPKVDPHELIKRRRLFAEKDGGSVSQAVAFTDAGMPISVKSAIGESRDPLSEDVLKNIDFYTRNKNNMGDYPTEPLIVDIIELLDQQDQIPIYKTGLGSNLPRLKSCLNVHANKCAKTIIATETISQLEAREAFIEAVDSYNIDGVIMLLESGFQPSYNHVDRLILQSENKKLAKLWVSSSIINRMLVELAERGIGIDDVQLKSLYNISPSTHNEIKRIQLRPYWERTCQVPGATSIRPDLKKLARELNLPPDIPKDELCRELSAISHASGNVLRKITTNLQAKRQMAHNTTLGDVIRKGSSVPDRKQIGYSDKAAFNDKFNKMSPSRALNSSSMSPVLVGGGDGVCVNSSELSRDSRDYADIDIVMIDEGRATYCFESIDYPTLLERGMNPVTENKLSAVSIREIQGKLAALNDTGVPVESKGLQYAINRVKQQGGTRDEYEEFIRQRLEEFLRESENYGIDRGIYLADPEYGGLSNLEMEALAKAVSQNDNIAFDSRSRQASLRSLSATVMEEVALSTLLKPPDNQFFKDGIFNDLADYIGVMEGRITAN